MTTNFYIIDTGSLVRLNRNSPLDVFPSMWRKLEYLVKSERLVSPKEVFYEIERSDDQLTGWAKKQKKMFIDVTPRQIEIAQEIMKDYGALVDLKDEFEADPWVIALAVELATSKQKTLFIIKRVVVTEEKIRGNRIKIPLVCKKYSIESIDIVTLFRTEGWKF